MFGQDLGMLGNLGELDRANKFYGLKYKPSWSEKLSSGIDKDTATAISILGAVRGSGGGAAPSSGGQSGSTINQWDDFERSAMANSKTDDFDWSAMANSWGSW